jgi:hypothetical protein
VTTLLPPERFTGTPNAEAKQDDHVGNGAREYLSPAAGSMLPTIRRNSGRMIATREAA